MDKPIKVLVLVADYPMSDKDISLPFVHVRNKHYMENGIDVTVLNFAAKKSYTIDNIPVITLKDYKTDKTTVYNTAILHAPNLRNHYVFLKHFHKSFENFIFVFHGHEILMMNDLYPKPYPYMRSIFKGIPFFRNLYDRLKLRIWKGFFIRFAHKSRFIFVSRWMLDKFLCYTKIDPKILEERADIIHNSAGKMFETHSYDTSLPKEYDFITVRSNLDGSKYCVDIVNSLAISNPNYKFLLYGKGQYFSHNEKANNLTWINESLPHNEIIDVLNKCRFGLMPTRLDSQGLMSCEFATFGIPLVTSDIDVCKMVLDGMPNVEFISNENPNLNLDFIVEKLNSALFHHKDERFFAKNTVFKEIDLLKKLKYIVKQ